MEKSQEQDLAGKTKRRKGEEKQEREGNTLKNIH